MIGLRFYFAGLTSILASACVCDPTVPIQTIAQCNVVPPGASNQDEVGRLGRMLVTENTFAGDLDVGGNSTNIVHIKNLTNCPIRVDKLDGFGLVSWSQAIEIGPGESFTGEMHVPWGDTGPGDRVMQIWISGQPYFRVWQKGIRVKFRSEAEIARLGGGRDVEDSAPSVPGETLAGGRRHVYIAMTTDGHPYFKFEAIQRR